MAIRTKAERTVNELSTMVYTATLEDEDGNALPLTSIDSLTLTLYDVATGDLLGGRSADQDVLNANEVTVHATSGLLTFTMLPADNPINGTPAVGELEEHVALFVLTYDTDKKLRHDVQIFVRQLAKSP